MATPAYQGLPLPGGGYNTLPGGGASQPSVPTPAPAPAAPSVPIGQTSTQRAAAYAAASQPAPANNQPAIPPAAPSGGGGAGGGGNATPSEYGTTVQTPTGPTYVAKPNPTVPTPAGATPIGQDSSTYADPTMPSFDAVSKAVAALQPQTPSDAAASEQSFIDKELQGSQGIIDAIENGFNSMITSAGKNAEGAAQGRGASPDEIAAEYTSAEQPIIEQRNTAVANALEAIRTQASNDYATWQSNNEANAKTTIASFQQSQTNLQKQATALAASGMTPDQLQQQEPDLWSYLTQYGFNGNETMAKAAMISANPYTLSSQVEVGGKTMYLYKNIGPNGVPETTTQTLDLSSFLQSGEIQVPGPNGSIMGQTLNPDGTYTLRPLTPVPPVAIGASGSYVYDPTTGGYKADTSIFNGGADPSTNATPADGPGGSILSATGLSVQAFNYLTQGVSSMSRMPTIERNQILNEAQSWANQNGVDLSTFQSQYQAYNQVLQGNIERNNAAQIQENELLGTVNNLETTVSAADLSNLKVANVAKLLAGQQVNDPTVTKYSTYLLSLQNELAGYNAAARGNLSATGGPSPDQSDMEEAAQVIQNGIASGSLKGFKEAIQSQQQKMGGVLQNSINTARQQVWSLFGVGDKFAPSDTNSSTQTNDQPQGGGNSSTVQPAGTIVTYQGQQYQVGADGNTLIPYTGQ